MFLQQLSIENLRSIQHLELSFRKAGDSVRKWTMLLGENGTGKSSVLRAIALLLAGRDALPDLLGEPSAWIRGHAKSARIAGTLCTKAGAEREISLELRRGASISDVLREALEQGRQVKLSGFGNFDLRRKNQRPGRNPKTGEEIPITARTVVTFRPGQKLRLRVELDATG